MVTIPISDSKDYMLLFQGFKAHLIFLLYPKALFHYLLKTDLDTVSQYLIFLSDLYSKGRQLSPLEGSCFHIYTLHCEDGCPVVGGFLLAPLLDVNKGGTTQGVPWAPMWMSQ